MNAAQPLFTVATITYNSGKWVQQAIESILSSSFTDFELLISDDCSTDNTWEIIKEYKDARIRAWRNESNIGEYPNRNKVLYQAKGEYIIYVDGDDLIYRNTLQMLYGYLQEFKKPVMIWAIPQPSFVVLPFLMTPVEIFKHEYFNATNWSIIGFAETVFHVQSLKDIGGMDCRFESGDVYIKKKLAMYGDTLLVLSGLCFWRTSPTQASKRLSKNYKGLRNMFFINKRILMDEHCPLSGEEKEAAYKNLKASTIKLLMRNVLLKGRVRDFFILKKEMAFLFSELGLVLHKQNDKYKINRNGENPFINSYNFRN